MNASEERLYQTILGLNDLNECRAFFKDLCTPNEIKGMRDRLEVAILLEQGELSYREIQSRTKVSLATITRVARFLTKENHQGYKLVLGKKK